MIITFIGHSFLYGCDGLNEKIVKTILEATKQNENITFYCGGYGDFDKLCAKACRDIKKVRPNCEIVFVTPYISESQQKKMKCFINLLLYDSIIYPPLENVPPRFAIIKRNRWMIENCDLVIVYIERTFGGAYKSFEYALKKGKKIINLAEE